MPNGAAAQPPTFSVDTVLGAIQRNIAAYSSSLPAFSCVEQISSKEQRKGSVVREVQVVSDLHVKRAGPDNRSGSLAEIRDIHTINGKPEGHKDRLPKLPLSIAGAFGDAFINLFDPALSSCYTYRIEQRGAKPDQQGLTLSVDAMAAAAAPTICARVAPAAHATVLLDPASFHILKITTEFPQAQDGGYRDLVIQYFYAPVTLANTQYLLPEVVTAEISKPNHRDSLHYQAHYSGYHKFDVTTRVIDPSPHPPDAFDR